MNNPRSPFRDIRRLLAQRDVKIIIAVFAPPLAVWLHLGWGLHFWVNIMLTLAAYIPGLVHAVWAINKR